MCVYLELQLCVSEFELSCVLSSLCFLVQIEFSVQQLLLSLNNTHTQQTELLRQNQSTKLGSLVQCIQVITPTGMKVQRHIRVGTYLGLGFDAAMQRVCAGQALDLLLQFADAVCQSVERLHQLRFVFRFH